jgi:hypothetical protein
MLLILGILVLIFVVGPLVLFYGLRYVALRSLSPNAPGRVLAITPAGFVLYGMLVIGLLVLFTVAGQPRDDALGRLLHRPGGLVAGIVVAVTLLSLAERALRRLGYPTTRVIEHRDV